MAKIIELCGIPGVGKSSIYNALLSSWNKNRQWIPADLLYPKPPIDFSSPRKIVSSLAGRIKGGLDSTTLKKAGEQFIARYPEYTDSSWDAIQRKHANSQHAPDARWKEAGRLRRSAEYIQFLIECNSQKYAIVDIGGLVQRLDLTWHTSLSLAEDKSEMQHLLSVMPLPAAVIYLYVDRQKNVDRLQSRKTRLAIHKNLSSVELEAFCKKYQERWVMLCDILEEMHVPLLKLNTDLTISTSLEKINSFVEQLASKNRVVSARANQTFY